MFIEEDYTAEYTAEYCNNLIQKKLISLQALPVECRRHVGQQHVSTKEEKSDVDPFAGMYSGQKAAAIAARKSGRPTHAVLERRYTKVRGSGAKAASSNH